MKTKESYYSYCQRYEISRALEEMMDVIEKDDAITEAQFEYLGEIYDNGKTWDDYWKLHDEYHRIKGN